MELVHVSHEQNHMATTFEFKIACHRRDRWRAEDVLARAHAHVGRLETELSEFISISPIYKLNRAAPGARVAMPASALELLERSARLRHLTEGSFDCAAKSSPGEGGRVAWDRISGQAWRLDEGARIGFGAIGKGYALDGVRGLLEGEGFRDFLLVAGGSSIVISGFAGPGRPWTWAWSWGRACGAGDALGIPFAHAGGEAIALGISGTEEQGGHLLDPRRGRTAGAGVVSALVAHPSAAEADALSTALYVAGWEPFRERLAQSVTGSLTGMAVIEPDDVPRWNGLFQRLWGGIAASAATLPRAFAEEEMLDLSADSAPVFNPHLFERHGAWVLLPIFIAAMILLHLKKIKSQAKPKGGNPFA